MSKMIMTRYKDEILKDIAALVKIRSIAGTPQPDAPNGAECAEALNFVLTRAKKMDFDTRNVCNLAGHAQYGNGMEIAAVLTHVDVVGAGSGWNTDPFSATMIGRRLYGRGVADDKGAAVAALYCLKAIKDMQIRGKRRLRVIWGSSEETGMNDMAVYFKNQPLPDIAFTPDSEYGICNREKGILQLEISGEPLKDTGFSFVSGEALNAVPDTAEISLKYDEALQTMLNSALKNIGRADIKVQRAEDNILLTVKGRAEHAMNAEKGVNAAVYGLHFLANFFDISNNPILSFIENAVTTAVDGKALGIACADEPSGNLTVNLGTVRINEAENRICFDIRYPVTCRGDDIARKFFEAAAEYGLCGRLLRNSEPLYLPESSRITRILSDAYETVVNQKPEFYSTGGGTYARTLRGKGVAFGPLFRDGGLHNLHTANEFIDIDEFMLHCEICLQAMMKMMLAD